MDDNFYEAEIMSPSVTLAADNIDENRNVAIFPDSEIELCRINAWTVSLGIALKYQRNECSESGKFLLVLRHATN